MAFLPKKLTLAIAAAVIALGLAVTPHAHAQMPMTGIGVCNTAPFPFNKNGVPTAEGLNCANHHKADTTNGALVNPTVTGGTFYSPNLLNVILPPGSVTAGSVTGLQPPATSPFGTVHGTVADGGALTTAQTTATNAQAIATGAQTTANAALPAAAAGPLATQTGATPAAAAVSALGFTPYDSANPNRYVPVGTATGSARDAAAALTAEAAAQATANAALPKAGGTMTSSLTLSAGAINVSNGAVTAGPTTGQVVLSGAQAAVNGSAATNRLLRFNTLGVNRWALLADAEAESGSNLGTNLTINAYDDTGNLLFTPLAISRSTGLITNTLAPSVSNNAGMFQIKTTTLTGSGTSLALSSIQAPTDNANMSNGLNDFTIAHNYGGPAFGGSRYAVNVLQGVNTAMPSGQSPFVIGYNMSQIASTPVGGTSSLPEGALMGYNGVTTLQSGATNIGQVDGAAFDMNAQAGSSMSQKIGVAIDLLTGDAVAGSALDTGLTFVRTTDAPNSPGWSDLISIGNINGWNPVNPTHGAIMDILYGSTSGAGSSKVADRGIDLARMNFNTAAFRSAGFSVGPTGSTAIGGSLLSSSSSGLSVDASGEVAGTPTIVNGGAGYTTGEIVTTGNGDLYTVTASAGAVTAISVLTPASTRVTVPPSNPLVLQGDGVAGNPATVNLTWTRASTLALNPSGGAVTVPTPTAGDNSTKAASTAFTTTAVGVEAARATAAEAAKLSLAGGTMTSSLTLSAGGVNVNAGAITEGTASQVQLSGAQATINGPAASNRLLRFNTAGGNRWAWLANGTAESGGNAGSDLQLNSYADDGTTLIGSPLSITRATGAITVQSAPAVTSSTTPQMQVRATSITGAGTGVSDFSVAASSDNAFMSAGLNDIGIIHNYGGSNFSGNRSGVSISQNLNTATPTGSILSSEWFMGQNIAQLASANQGGTGPLATQGGVYGINLVQDFAPGATYYHEMVGATLDQDVQAGAYVRQKTGLSISLGANDAVPGVDVDSALIFGRQVSAPNSPGWTSLISIGTANGWNPINPTYGSIMSVGYGASSSAQSSKIAYRGIDLSKMKFGNSAFMSPGFGVDGSGNESLGSGLLSWGTSGLTIDNPGEVATSATIASGGTPGPSFGVTVGEILTTGNGDLYTVTSASTGVLTGISVLVPATIRNGTPPANPLPLMGDGGGGATVNLTWAAASTLKLNPSGGAVTVGAGGLTSPTLAATALPSTHLLGTNASGTLQAATVASADVTTALGFTPLATTQVGAANGVAGLDVNLDLPLTAGMGAAGNRTTNCGVTSIGDAVGRRVGTPCTPTLTWVGNADGGLNNYFDLYSNFMATLGPNVNGMAIAGAARSGTGTILDMALAGYAQAAAGTTGGVWMEYLHGDQLGTGSVLAEHDVGSIQPTVAANPYQMGQAGTTSPDWLGAGGELCQQSTVVGCTNISTAIGIIANGTATNPAFFQQGITIGANAIAGDNGTTGTAPAIVMGKGHEIDWRFQNTTNIGGYLRSDASATTGVGGVFTNTGFQINDISFGHTLFNFVNGGTADGMAFTSSAASTGAGVGITAFGSDANIPVYLTPLGTGWLSCSVRDGTVTGGNGRGSHAVDWQCTRTNATQVATGTDSVIGGGTSNEIDTTGFAATIAGGNGIRLGGNSSASPGGASESDHADTGSLIFASGQNSAQGDAQWSLHTLRGISVAAAAIRLTADGAVANANNVINLPASGSYTIESGTISARDASGNVVTWILNPGSGIENRGTAATTAWVGGTAPTVTQVAADSGAAAWATAAKPVLATDTTDGTGGISITVTPTGATTTVKVVATLQILENS